MISSSSGQLAGDLLPDASVDQRVATGFVRSGMSTNEEGVEEDEYAAIYAKDRLRFMHAGLAERLIGVGAPARVVTELIA